MDGSEKLLSLMIVKLAIYYYLLIINLPTSNNIRNLLLLSNCFKNVKFKPMSYDSNKKAWTTSEIFEK